MQGIPIRTLTLLMCFSILGCGGSDSPSTPGSPTSASTTTTVPMSAFGPGTHLVGQDIEARRYFSDPQSGCFWERLSGLGGTLAETITNNFIGFDAQQEIVAVAPSDLAFQADGDCGQWFTTPRHGAQVNIRPGRWLVDTQVPAGTYRANTTHGCFWERLRNFSGELSGTIENDFVSGGGSQLVTIAATDLGFSTDEDCGVWTRVTTQTTESLRFEQSAHEIEANRRANRNQE